MTEDDKQSTESTGNRRPPPGRFSPPGRVRHDDSIDASSEDVDRTDEGHVYSAGYDSPMATRIGDEEDDDPRVERLRELHEGRHRSDGEHSLRESQRDKRRIAQALCSSLPLSKHERQQIVTIVESLDLEQFGHHRGIGKVTLGVVAVVVDEWMREVDDISETVGWSEEFRSRCEEFGLSMSGLSSIKQTVRDTVNKRALPLGTEVSHRDPSLPGPTQAADRPDEYWDARPASFWVRIARQWGVVPSDFKRAIPNRHRRIVDELRQWEPWTLDDVVDREDEKLESDLPLPDPVPEAVTADEADIEEEVEALVEEMESAHEYEEDENR